MVTLQSEQEKRMILAIAREKSQSLSQKGVFLLPDLTKNNALIENLVLQKRRELLDKGMPREKHKIKNLELFNDRGKVPIDMPEEISGIVKGF